MSDARKILDERLAKGELSPDEYDALAQKISTGSNPQAAPVDSPNTQVPASANHASFGDKIWSGVQILGGIAVVLFLVAKFTGVSSTGLTIGNINAKTTSVSLDMLNSSSKSGDVLVWIVKDDIRMCDRVFKMKADTKITKLTLRCRVGVGKFRVKAIWASGDKDKARLAQRININY